jgi:hypothetical protein
MAKLYVQTNTLFQAGAGSTIGAVSITLTSLTDIYTNVLTMANFGDKGYITLEPDTTNEEGATFTGIVTNANGTYTLTGVSTILAKSPYTETSGLIRTHSGGTKVVVTDNVAFWNTFANKTNDEVITGTWTFNNFPITPGNPNASDTVKGVTKLSIAPTVATNPIAVGANDPKVPTADPTTLFAPISVTGKSADIQIFTTNGTWTKPTGAKSVQVQCIGSGGGGGGGKSANNAGYGGGGGGGGAVSPINLFQASTLTSTVAITVGVAGTAGAGGIAGAIGISGGNGSFSSFGTYIKVNGGGGGTAENGGGGNAPGGAGGNNGATNPVGVNAISGQGAPSVTPGAASFNAEFGGGAGGSIILGGGSSAGGSSLFGGAGGGGGGSSSNSTPGSGTAGGAYQSYSSGGGGTSGATSSPGGAGTSRSGFGCGDGGGGGGGSTGVGGAGGAGGAPGAGGGGGGSNGSGGSAAGAGGLGGVGEVRVITYF